MALLAAQKVTQAGLEAAYAAAAAAGDKFANNGKRFLHVKNASVAQITVTVTTPVTVGSLAVADQTVDIPAGEDRLIGPFGAEFTDSLGETSISYSGATSVTLAVLEA